MVRGSNEQGYRWSRVIGGSCRPSGMNEVFCRGNPKMMCS